jgi:hypothetical protein
MLMMEQRASGLLGNLSGRQRKKARAEGIVMPRRRGTTPQAFSPNEAK